MRWAVGGASPAGMLLAFQRHSGRCSTWAAGAALPTRCLHCWVPPHRRAHRSSKVWPHRSRRLMRMAFAELTVALLNAIMFLLPNA